MVPAVHPSTMTLHVASHAVASDGSHMFHLRLHARIKVLVVIDTLQFLGLCCFLMIKVSAWSHFCLDRLWQRLLITLLKPLLTLSLFLATGSNEKKCLMWVHISLGSMFSDIEIAYRHPVVLLWCFECVYNLVYNTQFYHNIFKTCRCLEMDGKIDHGRKTTQL